jgi:ribose transport system permease protein
MSTEKSRQEQKSGIWLEILAKPETMVALALLVLVIVMCVLRPVSFPTARNMFNILRQSSLIAILAVGMGLVIITGGIDLSVGAVIAFSTCLGLWFYKNMAAPPLVVLLLVLAAGLAVGCINGILISKLGIPPFIVTLGMLSVCNGSALLISNGIPIRYPSTWISVFGGAYIGIIPVSVIVMICIVIIGHIFTNNTQTGRNIYAVGNSQRSAKLSGIFVDRVLIFVYSLTGLLAGICGLILIGQMDSADPSFGKGYELDVIAASVIGGISMTGGEGNVWGVLLGALLMSVLKSMFIHLVISGYWQTIILGLFIIGAVTIDSIRKKSNVR